MQNLATERNATQRNASQRNKRQRNTTQRNATATQRNTLGNEKWKLSAHPLGRTVSLPPLEIGTQRNAKPRNRTQRDTTQRITAQQKTTQHNATQRNGNTTQHIRQRKMETVRASAWADSFAATARNRQTLNEIATRNNATATQLKVTSGFAILKFSFLLAAAALMSASACYNVSQLGLSKILYNIEQIFAVHTAVSFTNVDVAWQPPACDSTSSPRQAHAVDLAKFGVASRRLLHTRSAPFCRSVYLPRRSQCQQCWESAFGRFRHIVVGSKCRQPLFQHISTGDR